MKIYFTGAIRGGRKELPMYSFIVQELKKYGTVLTEHVADASLSSFGETNVTAHEVVERETELLKQSDIVIAEVTTSSLGVGYTISTALQLGKKVICLYHGKYTDKLSAMIKGNKDVDVYTYEDENEVSEIFKKIFAK